MNTIRVALIGSGYIAHYHARGLAEAADVKVPVLCSLDGRGAKEFADKYGIEEVTDQINGLFGREDIQAAVIATPNKYHAPYAIEFMKNGKDVFVEKPMAVSALQGREMTECARKNERILMVGHMWRFDTEVNYVRDLVQTGKLGEIFKTKGYGIHVNWGPTGWFVDKDLAGGGALADMGVHSIDTVRYILGEPEPKEVYAKISTSFGDYDVDHTGVVMITWDTGAVSLIESGWWHPHMDGPEAATRLFGTKGYASLFPTELKFKVSDQPGNFLVEMPTKEEHCDQSIYDKQMAHFIECIQKRTTPSPGLDEGLAVLKIVDAAYRSSETNEIIKLVK